ncbi:serine/threonine-protein phosphatase 2A activator, partial [Tremellales sp. Uapishka_1]
MQQLQLPENSRPSAQLLTSDSILSKWQLSPGYSAFTSWLKRRCERVVGRDILVGSNQASSEPIRHLMTLLDSMMDWVQEVPLQQQSNQRFGNLAFRQYWKLVEERLPLILASAPSMPPLLLPQLLPLLIDSHAFGHPVRIDYGTGHELAFVMGLFTCVVSGWIGGEGKEEEEDELILRVFTRYLDLTTLLQMTYKLEPAGSHGVWGLDDYVFLPYLFGAYQLSSSSTTPSECLARAIDPSCDPKDLFTLTLHRLTLFKKGAAFSEHSPLLWSLTQMPGWAKIQSGLLNMFKGEVLGKRVVVQGLWIGGWLWGTDMPPLPEREADDRQVGTKVPWQYGSSSREQVLEATRSVWSTPVPRR